MNREFFIFLCCTYFVSAVSFINPCSLEDEKCLTKSSTNTLHMVINGNKKLQSPSLNPVHLPLVEIVGSQLHLNLSNLDVHGLADAKFYSVKFDTKKREIKAVLHVPQAILNGEYSVNGNLLVLKLKSHSKFNTTAVAGNFTWTTNYDIEEKNGNKHFLRLFDGNTDFILEKAYFYFHDIIPGDDELSHSTNELLNKEWEAVLKDLGIGISNIIGSVFRLVTNKIFTKFPIEEITIV